MFDLANSVMRKFPQLPRSLAESLMEKAMHIAVESRIQQTFAKYAGKNLSDAAPFRPKYGPLAAGNMFGQLDAYRKLNLLPDSITDDAEFVNDLVEIAKEWLDAEFFR